MAIDYPVLVIDYPYSKFKKYNCWAVVIDYHPMVNNYNVKCDHFHQSKALFFMAKLHGTFLYLCVYLYGFIRWYISIHTLENKLKSLHSHLHNSNIIHFRNGFKLCKLSKTRKSFKTKIDSEH